MNKLHSLVLATTMLVGTASVATAQELDDLDLTKGILALQCFDADSVDTPLVFVQGDAGWVLGGSEDVVVTEIADGFRLTTLADPSWMSLVTEERRGDWSVRVLSEIAFTNATCTNIQDLVEILTASMAPRIADNFSDIANVVAETIPALRAEITKLKQQSGALEIENTELVRREAFLTSKTLELNQNNIQLADENDTMSAELSAFKEMQSDPAAQFAKLTAENERLKADFEGLLHNSILRNAFKIGAFTTELGYDTSDKVGSDYKFDTSVQTNVVSCNSQFDSGHDLSDICLIALKKALLPNPD